MKRYNLLFLLRIILITILSLSIGILLSNKNYLISIFISVFLLWAMYDLYSFLKRTHKDMQRLINAIRFPESKITFNKFVDKGLAPELADAMEDSITHFNNKLFSIETEHQFYNHLLNRIDSGILVINKAGDIEWINKAALDEFEKPQPRHISDLQTVSTELPQILISIFPKETKIIKIKSKDGLHQLAITAVLFSAKGKELKLISIKNIESVLEESESDAWKKLIQVLTHEMMNSITPIISLSESFSEVNSKGIDPELMERAMNTIHRRSKGLVEFVRNYQKLTRIPSPVLEPVVAQEIVNDISRLLSADGIRFSNFITPEDIILNVDRGQMEQVLINLIKNAWDACQETPDPNVQIRIGKNEYQQPVITISDNGFGILPEVIDKIFIPFFTTKPGGSGIGLSICRQIINSHGGTISVASEPGKGCCFTIRI